MEDKDAFAMISALVRRTQPKHLPPVVAEIYKKAVLQLAFLLFDEDEWTQALDDPTGCPGYISDLVFAWGLLQRIGVVQRNKERDRNLRAFRKSQSNKPG